MVADRVERKLAAILAADVAGYSRLMGADEEGTLARLKAHRRELIDPKIAEHRGRIVKTTGDGMLVEFGSVVDAMRCAVELQRGMADRNAGVPTDQRIEFRVGINLGDIIIDNDDIHGDGVNIAARLETLAEPGSVYVSSAAWDQARGKVPFGANDLGDHSLKNIQNPVRVFQIAEVVAQKSSSLGSRAVDRATVAVMPFQNMTGESEVERFADGLTEDIITGLSHIRALSVIARNSTFAYKGRSVDMRQVGRNLRARYVLEGSVRRAGSRIRVTAQLIEAESGHHIWAEKMDREVVDIFALQDDFTRSVVASTQTQLILTEGANADMTDRSRARVQDLLTLAQKRLYELTPEAIREVRSLAEQALAIDPSSGFACRMMALALWHLAYMGCVPFDEAMARQALDFGQRSVQARDADEYCYWALSLSYLFAKDHDKAFATLDRALEINPNCSLAFGSKGTVLAWAGNDEAITYFKLCIQADPRNPSVFFRYFGWALVAYSHSRYQEAVENASKVVQIRPNWWLGHIVAAASYAQAGATTEAQMSINDLLRIKPDTKISSLRALPFKHPKDFDHLAEGLRRAGLPD